MTFIRDHLDAPGALISESQYQTLYQRSMEDPQAFWAEQAERYVSWMTKWDTVLSGNFADFNVQWFEGATLNVCYNCIDRHLPEKAKQTAIIWKGDDPNDSNFWCKNSGAG